MSQPLISYFIKIVIKHFGEINYVDSLLTENNIFKLNSKNVEEKLSSLTKVCDHLSNQKILGEDDKNQMKYFMLSTIAQLINSDYQTAMRFKHALGKLHSYFKNQLLSTNELLELGFNTL